MGQYKYGGSMKKKIVIVLGSKSDLGSVKDGLELLNKLKIDYRLEIISAHRNPEKLRKLCNLMNYI